MGQIQAQGIDRPVKALFVSEVPDQMSRMRKRSELDEQKKTYQLTDRVTV